MKKIAIFATIPFVLAVPPIVGWYAGTWLDEHLGTAPYLMISLIILGLLGGFKELIRLIRDYGDNS